MRSAQRKSIYAAFRRRDLAGLASGSTAVKRIRYGDDVTLGDSDRATTARYRSGA